MPPNRTVVAINLNTGHFVQRETAGDGTFVGTLFAPPGSALLMRCDTHSNTLERQGGPPGTILHVPDRKGDGTGTAFSGAGWTVPPNDVTESAPPWTLDGTIDRTLLQPGDTFRVRGTLRVAGAQIQPAHPIRLRTILSIERIADANGTAFSLVNLFSSSILTPTSLPIENAARPGSGRDTQVTLDMVIQPGVATVPIDLSLQTTNLPPGHYLPFLSFAFEGIELEPSQEGIVFVGSGDAHTRPMNAAGNANGMYLPPIRLGDPAPPRMFWSMFIDTLSNGVRGVRAVEDRDRYGIASRTTTSSDVFIVPRIDPATAQPYIYRLEPFVLQFRSSSAISDRDQSSRHRPARPAPFVGARTRPDTSMIPRTIFASSSRASGRRRSGSPSTG